MSGRALRAVIYSDLSRSTLVANFDGHDFKIGDGDSDTAVDSTGKTWTLHGVNGGGPTVIKGAGPQPVQARKFVVLGTLAGTDALVSIQALKPIIKAIGTPSESETAQVVIPGQGQLIVVGTASEAETAQAIIALKPIIEAIGFASEAEVAQVVIPVQPGGQDIAVGTATEIEVAQGVAGGKSVVIGFASEIEAAQAVIALKPIIQAIATVAEIESAQGVAAIKPIITPVGTVVETEAAQIVRYIKVLQIGTATETEVPITITIIKVVLVGQVNETEVAQIVVPGVSGLGDAGVLLTADDTGKAVAVVVVSKVAVLYDVVKIRS